MRYMRGDYYVVPPNCARIRVSVRDAIEHVRARGPDGKDKEVREVLIYLVFLR